MAAGVGHDLMAREGVHFRVAGAEEDPPEAPRAVPRWWRGPDPEPAEVARLYVREQRTEFDISVLLSISSARVAAILRDAGVPRRTARKQCPVDPGTLREMVDFGATRNSIAGKFNVSAATAARWFTEAGLLGPDPRIEAGRLRELYIDRQLTTREVAAELDVTKERVIRALTAAGFPMAAVRAPASGAARGGHRRGVGGGVSTSGDDRREDSEAFRGQRELPASTDRGGRADPTARYVRSADGMVSGGPAS